MKTRTRNTALLILLSLCVLFGLFIAITPTIISTRWGNTKFLEAINAKIPGAVQAKSISLSWFGHQKIEEFHLQDPHGNSVLSFSTLESDTPLYSFLFTKQPNLGNTTVKSFSAEIKKTKSGLTNLQESLGIDITNLELPNENASVSNVDIEVQKGARNAIKMKTGGITQQGAVVGKFDVDLDWSESENCCKVYAESFPTRLIDSLIGIQHPELSGLLPVLLGESIDLKINEESKNTQSTLIVEASSKNFEFHARGNIDKGIFHLISPAQARITATPAALKSLSGMIKDLKAWTLASPSEILIELSHLDFPIQYLSFGKLDSKDISLNGNITLPEAELLSTLDAEAGAKIRDFSIIIETPAQSDWISLISQGSYYIAGKPIEFRVDTTIAKPKDLLDLPQYLYKPREILFSLVNLPTHIIDDLLESDSASKAFGEYLTFRVQSSMNKPKEIHMSLLSRMLNIPSIALNLDQDILQGGSNWSGVLSIDKIVLANTNFTIHGISIPWKLKGDLSHLDLRFNGYTSLPNQEAGKFTGQLILAPLSSLEDATIDFQFSGEHLHAGLFELISGRSEIEPLFGATFNMDASLHLQKMQGNIRSNLHGEAGSVFLNASLMDKQIRLNEPFVFETKGREELGRQVLSKFGPLFNEFAFSDEPIRLSVSNENFSLWDPLESTCRHASLSIL